MQVKTIRQGDLTAECWNVQFMGLQGCNGCPHLNTDRCGGEKIRTTGKNEKGLDVPLKDVTNDKS